jgi:nicotinamidase-related amidase
MIMKKIALLIIDAQYDFCDPSGSLFVPGAEDDMKRVSDFIIKNKKKIDYIALTQDNHQIIDISHPSFWQDKDGKFPDPFTIITAQQVNEGEWSPRFAPQKAIKYIEDLEAQGEFPHCIWPEHCIVGSKGAAILDKIMDSVKEWSRQGRFYQVVAKGTNPLTEHFGAFRSNIPIQNQPETQFNQKLIQTLESFDVVYFAGEAKSHCVANTLKQAMDFPELAKKFVILEDGMSNVPGFENLATSIYDNANSLGIQVAKTIDISI